MTIAYYIASPTWGGGEQYVYELARQMKARYHVTPVFLFPHHSTSDMVNRFREVGECPEFRFTGKTWRFSVWAGKQLARLLDLHQVDVLHINSRQSYFLAAWAKHFSARPIRVIATQHLVRRAKNTFFWRWAYRQFDMLICVSKKVQTAYLAPWEGEKCPFHNVRVVLNSVPITQRTYTYHSDPQPAIFYHGRICEEKGVLELMQALETLQDLPFRVILAGDIATAYEKKWTAYLDSSPIKDRITYIGFRTDMAELIPQYQIGVLPSIVAEAGSLSLLENMALGLPTVASNNGSQPEFIKHGVNGFLCPPNSVQEWGYALRQLLTEPNLAAQMARQAQNDFFHDFNYEHFLATMNELYQL